MLQQQCKPPQTQYITIQSYTSKLNYTIQYYKALHQNNVGWCCDILSIFLGIKYHLFQDQYIWKNGLVVRTKHQIEVLTKKVEIFSSNIERSGSKSSYLKDMLDLNTELTGYFSAISDNVNVRDLFDFLTICFYEYEQFFKENSEQILLKEEERRILLPLAHDIVFNDIKNILDFITNNTSNYNT